MKKDFEETYIKVTIGSPPVISPLILVVDEGKPMHKKLTRRYHCMYSGSTTVSPCWIISLGIVATSMLFQQAFIYWSSFSVAYFRPLVHPKEQGSTGR